MGTPQFLYMIVSTRVKMLSLPWFIAVWRPLDSCPILALPVVPSRIMASVSSMEFGP